MFATFYTSCSLFVRFTLIVHGVRVFSQSLGGSLSSFPPYMARGWVKHSQQFSLDCQCTVGPESRASGEHRCVYPGRGWGGGGRRGGVSASRVRDPRRGDGCETCSSAWELVWGSRPLSPGWKRDPLGGKSKHIAYVTSC